MGRIASHRNLQASAASPKANKPSHQSQITITQSSSPSSESSHVQISDNTSHNVFRSVRTRKVPLLHSSSLSTLSILHFNAEHRQNNARLSELASKVTALRGVTVDIYNNASDQTMIERNTEVFQNMGTSIKNSSQRLGRMAQSGNKMAILKLAGIISGVVLLLWWIGGWMFGKGKGIPPVA